MVNGVLEQDAINIIYHIFSAAYRSGDIMLNTRLYGFYLFYVIVSPRLVPFI
jgi:hypothetical protein